MNLKNILNKLLRRSKLDTTNIQVLCDGYHTYKIQPGSVPPKFQVKDQLQTVLICDDKIIGYYPSVYYENDERKIHFIDLDGKCPIITQR